MCMKLYIMDIVVCVRVCVYIYINRGLEEVSKKLHNVYSPNTFGMNE
jgi:hypothetical protein